MRNENSDEVSNVWQMEIGGKSMQAIENKSLNHGDPMDVRGSQMMASRDPSQLDHAYPLVAGQQQQQIYYSNNNDVSNNNNVNAKANAKDENYIFKNENVWVSPIAKDEQTFTMESTNEVWMNANKFENATDQQKKALINSENNNKQYFRENSQELLQMLEKADNFDLLSYIGEVRWLKFIFILLKLEIKFLIIDELLMVIFIF